MSKRESGVAYFILCEVKIYFPFLCPFERNKWISFSAEPYIILNFIEVQLISIFDLIQKQYGESLLIQCWSIMVDCFKVVLGMGKRFGSFRVFCVVSSHCSNGLVL